MTDEWKYRGEGEKDKIERGVINIDVYTFHIYIYTNCNSKKQVQDKYTILLIFVNF